MQTSECKLTSLLFYSLSSMSLSNSEASHPSQAVLPSARKGVQGTALSLRRETPTARGRSRSYDSKPRAFRILTNEPLFSVEVIMNCGSLNLGEQFCKQGENISSLEVPKNSPLASLQILFPQQRKSGWLSGRLCSHPSAV